MKYLKIFTDFAGKIDQLNDTETGRLFRAMLLYAETGKEEGLKGNERFLWSTAKQEIDRQIDAYEMRCQINKNIATNRYESLPKGTNRYKSCQDKDKDKDKDKKNIKKNIGRKTDVFAVYANGNKSLLFALEEFADMRKRIKKPLSESTKERIVKKLDPLSADDAIKVLQDSVDHCWQDIYPEKIAQKSAPKSDGPTGAEIERMKRMLAEMSDQDG